MVENNLLGYIQSGKLITKNLYRSKASSYANGT